MDFARLREREALEALGSSVKGLSPEEARRRLLRYGPNTLGGAEAAPLAHRLLTPLVQLPAILLVLAATLCFLVDFLGRGRDMAPVGWAILAVAALNSLATFLHEHRARGARRALHAHLPPTAWVLRAGTAQQVPRRTVVPGDVLLLEAGERIPADGRVLQAVQLRVDLGALAGAPLTALRQSGASKSEGPRQPLEAQNLVFAGAAVLSGHGQAVVTATGPQTELGRLARAVLTQPPPGAFQPELARLTQATGVLATATVLLMVLVRYVQGLDSTVTLLLASGLILGTLPHGLRPAVTLSLAVAARRLSRRGVRFQRLGPVETLGRTTVLCTETTGVLTERGMEVARLFVDGDTVEVRGQHLLRHGRLYRPYDRARLDPFFEALALCNNAPRSRREKRSPVAGDASEAALLAFARRHLRDESSRGSADHRLAELPFDRDRQRMTTLHWRLGRVTAYTKGAAELLLPHCTRVLVGGRDRPMTAEDRKTVADHCAVWTRQGTHVVAVAMRRVELGSLARLEPETVERELTFLGLVAVARPVRSEASTAVARCREADVRVLMITKDDAPTALAIAREVGLQPALSLRPGDHGVVIEGQELDHLDDKDLREVLRSHPTDPGTTAPPLPIFAGMAPRQRLRIVSLLQGMGEVVAVAAGSVPDAAALTIADVGMTARVAASDVAKESADVELQDDHLRRIMTAIEQSRAVSRRVRDVVMYLLAGKVPQVSSYLLSAFLPIPPPLTLPMMLAIDMGTGIVPALALGVSASDDPGRETAPRTGPGPLVDVRRVLRIGLGQTTVALLAFLWFLMASGWTWGSSLDWTDVLYRQATTVTFAAIVVAQVVTLVLWRRRPGDRAQQGRVGLGAGLVVLLLLVGLVYTAWGNEILGTLPLPGWIWVPLVAALGGGLLTERARQWFGRRGPAG